MKIPKIVLAVAVLVMAFLWLRAVEPPRLAERQAPARVSLSDNITHGEPVWQIGERWTDWQIDVTNHNDVPVEVRVFLETVDAEGRPIATTGRYPGPTIPPGETVEVAQRVLYRFQPEVVGLVVRGIYADPAPQKHPISPANSTLSEEKASAGVNH